MPLKDATIIGFRVLVDSEGLRMTEQTELPDEHIPKAFKEEEAQVIIRAAIRSFKEITGDIHVKLESEIDAINRVC